MAHVTQYGTNTKYMARHEEYNRHGIHGLIHIWPDYGTHAWTHNHLDHSEPAPQQVHTIMYQCNGSQIATRDVLKKHPLFQSIRDH